MIWYDMIWYDTIIWYDMIWYDMIWFDTMWHHNNIIIVSRVARMLSLDVATLATAVQPRLFNRSRSNRGLMYDVWCMMVFDRSRSNKGFRGVWCMTYDVWCMMYDVWCMMYDVWCMMYDVWCMMYDVWWISIWTLQPRLPFSVFRDFRVLDSFSN